MTFGHELPLHDAERGFTLLGENFSDGFPLQPFNGGIAVDHREAELVRNRPADGGLARAHEADQVEVDVRCVHRVRSHETAEFCEAKHQIT